MKEFRYILSTLSYYLKQKNFKEGIVEYNKLFEPKYHSQMYLEKWHDVDYVNEYYKKIYKYYEKLWHKEDLTDKTIFIFFYHCGVGDHIMLARYIPILSKQAGKVIIEMKENLAGLYKYNFPDCEIVDFSEKATRKKYDYTYHHELFLNFQEDLKTFPYSKGYLKVDPDLVEKYSSLFKTDKKKVGIFWSSLNTDRSVPNDLMHTIFENDNCQFYSLSANSPNSELNEMYQKYNIIDLSEYLKDEDCHKQAAIMKNLDLVITIDTSIVHFAGALGIKTYLMLNYESTWRWFNDYHTTPWYDSVKIFKQNFYNQWDDVVKSVSDSLKFE